MRCQGGIDPASQREMATSCSFDPRSKSNPLVFVSNFRQVIDEVSPNVDHHHHCCANGLEM